MGFGSRRDRALAALASAVLALASSPALGQSTGNSAAAATQNGTVGPAELKNFSLGKPGAGDNPTLSVTPAPSNTPPPASSAAHPPLGDSALSPSTRSVFSTRLGGDAPTRSANPPASEPTRRVEAGAAPSAEAPKPGGGLGLGAPDFPVTAAAPPPTLPDEASDAPLSSSSGRSLWPWLLVLLAALGAGAAWWNVRRRPQALAFAGGAEPLLREPAPAPQPRSPQPSPRAAAPQAPPAAAPPKPAAPASLLGGIVARSLQPRIEFELTPVRVDIDASGQAMVLFDLVIINSGTAPARQLLIEGKMFNAGPQQDEQIAAFFRTPRGVGERISLLGPADRLQLRSRVALKAESLQPVEYEGRKLLVPLVAFNALYRGPSGEQQDSASFLVGRGGQDGGKMGAFAIDQGARGWTDLSVRQHSTGLS